MSLLNDMLKDLENNRSEEPADSKQQLGLSVERESRNAFNYIRLVLFIVLTCVVGYLLLSYIIQTNLHESVINGSINEEKTLSIEKSLSSKWLHEGPLFVSEKLVAYASTVSESERKIATLLGNVIQAVVGDDILANEISRLPSTAAGRTNQIPEKISKKIVVTDVKAKQAQKSENTKRMTIARSSRSLDVEAATRSQVLIAKKKYTQAEAELVAQVSENADAVLSVQVLVDFYYDRKERTKLMALSTNTYFVDKSLRAYTLSRLYALDGENTLALSLLRGEKPHPLVEEKYLGLQAALYQQTGAYTEAEALFEQLLKKNYNTRSLWLGYALSCDANLNYRKALTAYRQVLRFSGSSEQVIHYAQKRIQILAQETAERG